MSSCMSPWPCRPVPLTPRSIVSLGGVWANRRRGRITGAIRDTPAALRKFRRVISAGGFVRGIVRSFASTYHYDEETVNGACLPADSSLWGLGEDDKIWAAV